MKKLIVLLFVCVMVVIACGKKIMPESDANNRSGDGKDKTAKSASKTDDQNISSTTTPSFNNMQSSVPPPMESPRTISAEKGKTVYVTKCSGCHALKNPGDYTTDQWNTILLNEIPKAKLDKKESDDVTAYIISNAKK